MFVEDYEAKWLNLQCTKMWIENLKPCGSHMDVREFASIFRCKWKIETLECTIQRNLEYLFFFISIELRKERICL